MHLLQLTVPSELNRVRVDKALVHLTDFSRSQLHKLIKAGNVRANDITVPNRSFRVETGMLITIEPRLAMSDEPIHDHNVIYNPLPATMYHFDQIQILYECDDFSIIHKPRGLAVHQNAKGDITLAEQLYAYYAGKLSKLTNRPGIVHRLDCETSGLMLIAKTDRFHQYAQVQFEQRLVEKYYLAKVHNTTSLPQHFMIESFIGPHQSKKHMNQSFNQTLTVLDDIQIGNLQPGTMGLHQHIKQNNVIYPPNKGHYKYALLECWKYNDLLLCKLYTGRQHQIRVQLAQAGHYILHDKMYGRDTAHLPMCLYAYSIAFNYNDHAIKLEGWLPDWYQL